MWNPFNWMAGYRSTPSSFALSPLLNRTMIGRSGTELCRIAPSLADHAGAITRSFLRTVPTGTEKLPRSGAVGGEGLGEAVAPWTWQAAFAEWCLRGSRWDPFVASVYRGAVCRITTARCVRIPRGDGMSATLNTSSDMCVGHEQRLC